MDELPASLSSAPSPQGELEPNPLAAPPARTSGLAVAALVLGLVGLLAWCTFVPSILGIVFGSIALGPIRRGESRGRGFALSGIILGGIGLLAGAATVFAVVRSPESEPVPGTKVTQSQRAALETMNVVEPGESIELLYAEGLWSVKDGGVVITAKRLVRYTGGGNVDSWPLDEVSAVAFTPAASFFDDAQFVVERDNGELLFFGIFSRGGSETFRRVLTHEVTQARRGLGKPPPSSEISSMAKD